MMTPRPQASSVIGTVGNGLDPARTKHMQGRGDRAGGGGVGAGVVAAPSARDAIAGNHVRQ